MDAKVNTFRTAFIKDGVVSGGWTNYDRLLERQLYNHNILEEDEA